MLPVFTRPPAGEDHASQCARRPLLDSSPIDLRHLNEKEAGIKGPVKRVKGGFQLGDGSPVRFWMVQGDSMKGMEKGMQDFWARRLAKYGVNLVRLGCPKKTPDDKFNYLVHALKKLRTPFKRVSRTGGDGLITYDEISGEILQEHKIIVNCTPLGMFPKTGESPPIPYELLDPTFLCYDLIYNPSKSKFLLEAEKRECAIMNGLLMLHLQARMSWDVFLEG